MLNNIKQLAQDCRFFDVEFELAPDDESDTESPVVQQTSPPMIKVDAGTSESVEASSVQTYASVADSTPAIAGSSEGVNVSSTQQGASVVDTSPVIDIVNTGYSDEIDENPPQSYAQAVDTGLVVEDNERETASMENQPELVIKEVIGHDNRSEYNGGVHFKVKAKYIGETNVKPSILLRGERNRRLLRIYLKLLKRTKSRRLRALFKRNPEVFTVLDI